MPASTRAARPFAPVLSVSPADSVRPAPARCQPRSQLLRTSTSSSATAIVAIGACAPGRSVASQAPSTATSRLAASARPAIVRRRPRRSATMARHSARKCPRTAFSTSAGARSRRPAAFSTRSMSRSLMVPPHAPRPAAMSAASAPKTRSRASRNAIRARASRDCAAIVPMPSRSPISSTELPSMYFHSSASP
jgi:hypothetical protein